MIRTAPVLHPLLVCPRCRGPLRAPTENAPSDRIECNDCGRRFPIVAGIPCLLADPHAEIDEWCFRADDFVRDNAASRDKLLAQVVGGGDVLPRTRARVQRAREHLEEHRDRLLALAQAGGIEPRKRSTKDRERVPGESTLTAYYHQLHRDWGWGDRAEVDEVAAAVAAIEAVLPAPRREPAEHELGDVLVLGAGACRVPWELHRRRRPRSTLALDLNPLPFIVVRKLLDGDEIKLFEFPIRPRSSESAVVEWTYRLDTTPDDNAHRFYLAFADGLDPPVSPHRFDTVITPWFIDQIPKDLGDIFATLRAVLKPGGTWINHGPLIYHPAHTAFLHRYCVDEVLELAEAAGFSIETHAFTRMPYMVSPAGSAGRSEMVLTLRATMRAADVVDAPSEAESEGPPAWLTDPTVPIPRLPGLESYQPPHPMFAVIASAIDGTATAADIGRLLSQKHNVPAGTATEGVLAALGEIRRALSD